MNLPGIFQWQFTKYPALHKGTCHIQEVQMLQSLGMGSPQDLAAKNAQQSHTSLRAPVSAGLQLMADHFGKNWIQQIYKSQSFEDVVFSCKDGQGILDSSCCNHLLQPPHCPVVIPQNCWRKMFSESHFLGNRETRTCQNIRCFLRSLHYHTTDPHNHCCIAIRIHRNERLFLIV